MRGGLRWVAYERHWGFDNCLIPFLFTKEVRKNRAMQFVRQEARQVLVPAFPDHPRSRAGAALSQAAALRSRLPIPGRRMGAAGQHPYFHQPVAARRPPGLLSQHLRGKGVRMSRIAIARAGAVVAPAFLLASAVANFMFGISLGRTQPKAMLIGIVGVFAVAMNALSPFFLSWSLAASRKTTAASIIVLWSLCLIYSTTSALGFAAQNREGVAVSRQITSDGYEDTRRELLDLENRRKDARPKDRARLDAKVDDVRRRLTLRSDRPRRPMRNRHSCRHSPSVSSRRGMSASRWLPCSHSWSPSPVRRHSRASSPGPGRRRAAVWAWAHRLPPQPPRSAEQDPRSARQQSPAPRQDSCPSAGANRSH